MKDIVLSMAQTRSVAGDIQSNFERMKTLIKNVQRDSDMICFPEASLTGYETGDPGPFCISVEDAFISEISVLSEEYGINIIFGFMERHGANMHITQAISDAKGSIHIYRKTHLGRKEREKFVPGNEIPVFKLPSATIGIQLCWESHFPDISTRMRRDGVEIILMPYASPRPPDHRRDIWMKHLPARAYDNGIFIGAVNAVGENGRGINFGGGIMVFDPKGNIIAEHFGRDDNVITVSLPSSARSILGPDDKMGNTDYFIYRRDDLY